MYRILDRYIRTSLLYNILIVFLVLISLSSIIRLSDKLCSVEKQAYSVHELFLYTLLSLPKDFDLFFPISTLLGSLLGLSVLEIRNELIIMRVFGVSNLQISFSIMKIALFIVLINIISNEWVLSYSQQIISELKNREGSHTYLCCENNKSIWLKENNGFIFIEYMLTIKNLVGIDLYFFSKDGKLKKIVHIDHARYINNAWLVSNATILYFSNASCFFNKKDTNYKWDTTLTPNVLSIITVNPRILSISKLIFCIEYFNEIGQNFKYHQLILWNKILSPIANIVMIIIAMLYNFGPFCHKKLSIRLLSGSVIGFLFYIICQLFGILSMIYNISPFIGSMSPIMLFLVINIIIIYIFR